MTYRVTNNVGYKKIYPMSLMDDETFCHYCGRTAGIYLQLEWDHVPALNVKIPEEYGLQFDIRKTLIRSCSECNGLATDTPHLDYLERHYWLKTAYLRRYKRVFVEGDPSKIKTVNLDIPDSKVPDLWTLLTMLGFGIKDVSLIHSPILEIRNKITTKKIESLLIQYLTVTPHDIDEEELMDDVIDEVDDHLNLNREPDIQFLEEFIFDEAKMGNLLINRKLFNEWVVNHPSRAVALDIEIGDFKYLSSDALERIKQGELNIQVIKNSLPDKSELHIKLDCSASFPQFIDYIINNVSKTFRLYRESYQKLYIQKSLGRLGFPQEPDIFYQKTWPQIRSMVFEKSRAHEDNSVKKNVVKKFKPKTVSKGLLKANECVKEQRDSIDKQGLIDIFSKIQLGSSLSNEVSLPSNRERLLDINNESLEHFKRQLSEYEVVDFLNKEYLLGNKISDLLSYLDWRNENPQKALTLPIRLTEHVNLTWQELSIKVKNGKPL
jgi:hypothetical protein